MYKQYINRIIGFLTVVMIILFTSSLSAQYISGPTTVTFGDHADYYFMGASNSEVSSASWTVDYGSVQTQSTGVNYVSALFSYVGTSYIYVDYFNGFYWDQVYLQVEVVDSNVSTPILSVIQPSCTNSMGSLIITNYNGSYNYSVSPSNGVEIGGSLITAPVGSYTVTATSGAYSSSPSAIVTLNAQPITPVAPTVGSITQPTDPNPTGSVVLSNLPSSGSWIINPGNISGTGTTKTITGLAPSITYNFTVTNASGCVSNASAPVEIDIQPSGAIKPTLSSVTQPSCTTSTGSFTITNYNASYTYSVNPSTGVFISGSTVTVPTGSYTIMATSASGINSIPSASITVNTQPAAPAAPIIGTITQPTATTTGSVVLSNLPSNGNWIINPGNISGNGSTITIKGLAPSVQPYKFTVTNTSGCISGSSSDVVIDGYCGISDENYVYTVTPTIATNNVSTLSNSQKIEGITYYDGLGRPIQKIGIRAGEVINDITKTIVLNDIINPIEYDEFGRQTKEYLPYTDTFNCGAFRGTTLMNSIVTVFYNTNKYENTLNPYSEKQFEASPLNRVFKQAAPGNDWKLGGGHEIKLNYQTNLASEVKNFGASLIFADNTYTPTLTQSAVNGGYYNANQLYKTVTYDENTSANPTDETKGSTVEFRNKEGQVLLKRTYGTSIVNGVSLNNISHDTYYVYDDHGNLTFVIPPKASDIINTGSSNVVPNLSSVAVVSSGSNLSLVAPNSITLQYPFHAQAGSTFTATIGSGSNPTLDELCYQYKYDHRNRLVEKKLPGKQWEFILYDKLDRVVATGPAFPPFNDTAVGATGWLITKYDVFSRPIYTGWEQSTTVNSAGRILKQNALNSATTLNESKQASGTIDGIAAYYTNTVAPSSFKLLTVNYYDNYTYPSVPTIPTTVETQTVLATTEVKGLVTGSWTRIPTSTASVVGEIVTTFYDKKARPIRMYTQNFLGGYTYSDSKLDFTGKPDYSITYHKRVASSAELKTKDTFTYSPQGRLMTQSHQINDGTVEQIASNTYDELGQLTSKAVGGNTQKVDYTYNIRGWLKGINNVSALQQGTDPKDLFAFAINYNTIPSGIPNVKALYNGNIAETQWATNSDNGVLRTYGYRYDDLNRLKEGIYKKGAVLNAYNENMTYDKNGNIMHLNRFGSLDDNTQTQIDNLTYDYKNSNASNQLMKVSDAVVNNISFKDEFKDSAANATDDFDYDANGNMTKDNNKNITSIIYNHLNLPTKITFATTGNIVYIYNAAGQKVQKIFTQGASTTTTDYLGGYQYNNAILKFFPTAEGYVEPSGSSYKYVYQYRDHLGNVRLSYDKNLNIQEESNYYPFGLKQTGYGNNVIVNSDYKYKYQGQERQDELGLNWDSFKWRNYDYAIGRFMNVDPLAEKYAYQSPYNFSENRVVDSRELEGLEAIQVTSRIGTSIMTSPSSDSQRHNAAISFALFHPMAANSIGEIERGGTNISSVSGRIARHMTDNNNMSGGIGSESNAFRHALWSATMTNEEGSEIATQAGNAHEGVSGGSSLSVDFSSPLIQNADLADSVVDVLNNQIGRNIAKGLDENASQTTIAKEVLKVQKTQGLWEVSTDKNGNMSVSRKTISQKQYQTALKTLNNLDNNGFNEKDKKDLDSD